MAEQERPSADLTEKIEGLKRSLFMREAQDAALLYKDILEHRPDFLLRGPVQYDLACVLERAGQEELAMEAYRLLLELQPDNKSRNPALRSAGHLAFKLKKEQLCKKYLTEFVKTDPLQSELIEAQDILGRLPSSVKSEDAKEESKSVVVLSDYEGSPEAPPKKERAGNVGKPKKRKPAPPPAEDEEDYGDFLWGDLPPTERPREAYYQPRPIPPQHGGYAFPFDQAPTPKAPQGYYFPPGYHPPPGYHYPQPATPPDFYGVPPQAPAPPAGPFPPGQPFSPPTPPSAPPTPIPSMDPEPRREEPRAPKSAHVPSPPPPQEKREDPDVLYSRLRKGRFALILPRGKRIRLDEVATFIGTVEGIDQVEAKKHVLSRKGLLLDNLTLNDVFTVEKEVEQCRQSMVFVHIPSSLRPNYMLEILSARMHEKGLKMSTEHTREKIRWGNIRLINCGILHGDLTVSIIGGTPTHEYRFIEKVFDLEEFSPTKTKDLRKGIHEFLDFISAFAINAERSHTVDAILSGKVERPQVFSGEDEYQSYNNWMIFSRDGEEIDSAMLRDVSNVTSDW